MFILDRQLHTSSPDSMGFDSKHSPDSGKKRKRGSEQLDDSFAHSLSAMVHDSCQPGLPTPPHSSFSTFADVPLQPLENTRSPTPSSYMGTPHFENVYRAPKRPHLTPQSRRPPMPTPRASTHSVTSAISTSSTGFFVALPCHRCHRTASRHSDLASFTSCEACGQSTCGVCIRQCQGQRCRRPSVQSSDGPHGKRVCAGCCVEVGCEGRVWCLTCYHSHEDDVVERNHNTIGKTGKQLQTERVGMIAAWLNSCGDEMVPMD